MPVTFPLAPTGLEPGGVSHPEEEPQPMYLNLPEIAVGPLRDRLDRQSQMHAAAIAGTAGSYMHDRPYASIDACITANNCPPRRTGGPLCLLCAVDHAVERHAMTHPESFARELFAVGTIVKQSAIDVVMANPDADIRRVGRESIELLSMRLHNGNLIPATAAQQEEVVMRFRCLRAIDKSGYRGRIREVSPDVLRDLEMRGWAVGGYVTPHGRAVADAARREQVAARR